MGIIETIARGLEKAQRERQSEAHRLIRDTVKGGGKTDFAKLSAAVEATGADWRLSADILDRVEKLRPLAATAEAKREASIAAAQTYCNHQRLIEETVRTLGEKLWRLRSEHFGAQAIADRAMAAVRDIESLHHDHPALFGAAPIDVDLFTLVNRGSVISTSDPAAPEHGVSDRVFLDETHRRLQILGAARQTAEADYDDAMKQWEGRAEARGFVPWLVWQLPKTLQAEVGTMPELAEPTWRDVLHGMGKGDSVATKGKRNARRVQ